MRKEILSWFSNSNFAHKKSANRDDVEKFQILTTKELLTDGSQWY